MRPDLQFNLVAETNQLDDRIQQFKEDEEKMLEIQDFVNGVLSEAELEVEKKMEIKLVS